MYTDDYESYTRNTLRDACAGVNAVAKKQRDRSVESKYSYYQEG